VSLEGTSLRPDNDANREVYGRKLTARTIITGAKIHVPVSGEKLVAALEKGAPYNESKRTTR
jgi:lipid-binding SYLF domain-containing protein